MKRPCLWCDATLDTEDATPTRWSVEPSALITCQCGIVYSVELVEQAEDETWAKVKARDGYSVQVDGTTLWITDLEAAGRR